MTDLVFQDFVFQDHQRRIEEGLRNYELFNRDRTDAEQGTPVRLTGRWLDAKGVLRLCWTVAYGFALNKS